MNPGDDSFFDAMHAFGPPLDPLDAAAIADHPATAELRDAREQLRLHDPAAALTAISRARTHPIPTELRAYCALVEGVAHALTGNLALARTLLEGSWNEHPDVAALPAALGATLALAGDGSDASAVLFAALVCDDPDRSLSLHRRLLTLLLAPVQSAGANK